MAAMVTAGIRRVRPFPVRRVEGGVVADNRRNIKVSPEVFEELTGDKPDGVTWDYYLTEIRTPD